MEFLTAHQHPLSFGKRRITLLAVLFALVALCPAPWRTAHAGVILNAPNYTGLNSGLVGYWSFDGQDMTPTTALDRSGNAINGTLLNGPKPVQGRTGQGLNFDALDDVVDPEPDAALENINVKTMSAWIKPRSFGPTEAGTILADNLGDADGFRFEINADITGISNVLVFRQSFSGTSGLWRSPANSIVLNTWQHVVVIYDRTSNANDPRMYINGSEVTVTEDTPPGANPADAEEDILIGGNTLSGGGDFDGTLDDIRIYNRALSDDEIKRLYKIGGTLKLNKPASTGSLTDGLVGYWSFDGNNVAGTANTFTAYDSSGNGQHATSSSSNIPMRSAGRIGQALRFDGANDELKIGGRTSALEVTTDYTFSAWFRRTTTGTEDLILNYDNGFSSWCTAYNLTLNSDGSNRLSVNNQNGSNDAEIFTTASISTGVWTHVAAVHRNGRTTFYINGAFDSDQAQRDPVYNGGGNYEGLQIGAGGSGADCAGQVVQFDGSVDELRIYNRALSAQEIKRLYRMGGTLTVNKPANTGSLTNGLVGYWPFDGSSLAKNGSGVLTSYDLSGNNNTGSSSGAVVPKKAQGKIGQALDFDGVNDYVRTETQLVSYMSASDGSMSVWVRPEGPPVSGSAADTLPGIAEDVDQFGGNGGHALISRGDIGGLDRIWVGNYDGTMDTVAIPFTLGEWANIVWVHTGGILYGYKNGTLVGSIASGNTSDTSRLLMFGLDGNVPVDYFKGSIDDVRIYNRALSADEIKRLYLMGNSR